ncbi:hypothetical protein FACS1894166_07010 [Bacilli bacterium]|nr:hypothetical protein FACS1894166_07010 [Bacilli bacterium]
MKKCAIVVDSSFGIKNGQYPDVYVCPLIITVDDHDKITSYHDEIDIFNKELCEKLSAGMNIKTSQSISGEVIDMFEKLSKDYDEVHALPITKTLSSTYNT